MTEVALPGMPPGPSPEELLLIGLRKRYLELGARIEEYERERAAIKTRVRRLGAGTHPIGEGKATISPQKRFSPQLAEQVLTRINPELIPACSKTVIASDLVKQFYGDLVYEQCQQTSGEDRVVIS